MAALRRRDVYRRLKRLLADITKRKVSDIDVDTSLRDDLGFTDVGLRALAEAINQAVFSGRGGVRNGHALSRSDSV